MSVCAVRLDHESCDAWTYIPKTSALTFFHLVKVSVHSACLGYLGQFKNYAVPIQKKTSIYLYILVILKEYQYY